MITKLKKKLNINNAGGNGLVPSNGGVGVRARHVVEGIKYRTIIKKIANCKVQFVVD